MKSNNNIILNWKKSCDLLIDESSITYLSDEYEILKYKIKLIIIRDIDDKESEDSEVSELLENFEKVNYPFNHWCDSLKEKNYDKSLFVRGNNTGYIIENPCIERITHVVNCVKIELLCYSYEEINKQRFVKEKIDELLDDIR
jgi:hypothetical protein